MNVLLYVGYYLQDRAVIRAVVEIHLQSIIQWTLGLSSHSGALTISLPGYFTFNACTYF
jgi:hypothetical protein